MLPRSAHLGRARLSPSPDVRADANRIADVSPTRFDTIPLPALRSVILRVPHDVTRGTDRRRGASSRRGKGSGDHDSEQVPAHPPSSVDNTCWPRTGTLVPTADPVSVHVIQPPPGLVPSSKGNASTQVEAMPRRAQTVVSACQRRAAAGSG